MSYHVLDAYICKLSNVDHKCSVLAAQFDMIEGQIQDLYNLVKKLEEKENDRKT